MLFRFAVPLIGVLLLARPGSAQGLFEPFGFPVTATATGHTEVLGSVHVALRQGTPVADALIIDVSPLRITNGNGADVRVTTSGNVTVGSVTIEAENGQVRVPVNAGGTSGSFRVDGIRVSLAGTNSSSVTARLSWAGRQNILTPRESVVVVDRVQSGLAVEPVTENFLIFASMVVDGTAAMTVSEGYSSAFTSGADFGQNAPTRLRIRVTDFPAGLQMSFPASVTSNESAATLSTVEGAAITLPRGDGSTDVTYNFNGAADSAGLRESFTIPFTVSTGGTVENLQPTIEVSLASVGAAVPSTTLPTTNIPRYAEENLVALEGTSRIITKTMYWTGIDSSLQNRLSLFNPSSRLANVTLSALDTDGRLLAGAGIDNPVPVPLAANQSSDQLLTAIFGTAASNVATVRVQSTGRDVVALGTASGANVTESTPLPDRGIANFVLPAASEGSSLHLFNPGPGRISGTLTLRTRQGTVLATKTIEIEPLAATTRSFSDLFGAPSEGQLTGSFAGLVVAFESFGSAAALNFVPAQVPAGVQSLYVPFFASGAGYETDLSLINSSGQAVTLTAQVFDNAGLQASPPRQIALAESEQLSTTVAQLFQMQGFTSGYVRIQVPQMAKGFWTFYPAVSGHARIRSGQSSSTVIPISGYPHSDSSMPASGASPGQFQGIALVNPNSESVSVTMQALASSGQLLGTATVNLAAGQISSRLVGEYFTATIPDGSVIRLSSAAPIVATSITGSLNGDSLRAAPALR